MDKLVEKLEQIRRSKKLSLEAFALQELGVSSQSYWRWTKGRQNPSRLSRRIIVLYLREIEDEERAKEGAQ